MQVQNKYMRELFLIANFLKDKKLGCLTTGGGISAGFNVVEMLRLKRCVPVNVRAYPTHLPLVHTVYMQQPATTVRGYQRNPLPCGDAVAVSLTGGQLCLYLLHLLPSSSTSQKSSTKSGIEG